jgi:2-amino-4-hydroxy-6-hydroxymethyldihydropteridine diphosphokinase
VSQQALIGLGANLLDPIASLNSALERLADLATIDIERVSTVCQSQPIGGPPNQAPFANAVATLTTTLRPHQLLDALLAVEKSLGRERTVEWGPRTIDLDLLLFGDQQIADPQLTVPHPRMAVRSFVLQGAAEISPAWRHPWIARTMAELWDTWQRGPQAIAVCGDPAERQQLLAHLLAAVPALAEHRVAEIGDLRSVVEISASRGAAHRASRLAVVVRHELVAGDSAWLPGPTLCVDLASPRLVRRDLAAAITDAWPDLG